MFIFGIALMDQRNGLNLRAGKSLENGNRTMNDEVLITECCNVRPVENTIDYDSVDGAYGQPIVVAHGECSSCQEWSRLY